MVSSPSALCVCSAFPRGVLVAKAAIGCVKNGAGLSRLTVAVRLKICLSVVGCISSQES